MDNTSVIISLTEYEDLLNSYNHLAELEAAGVDNWGGFCSLSEEAREDVKDYIQTLREAELPIKKE